MFQLCPPTSEHLIKRRPIFFVTFFGVRFETLVLFRDSAFLKHVHLTLQPRGPVGSVKSMNAACKHNQSTSAAAHGPASEPHGLQSCDGWGRDPLLTHRNTQHLQKHMMGRNPRSFYTQAGWMDERMTDEGSPGLMAAHCSPVALKFIFHHF